MREVSIDVRSEVCPNAVEKIQGVLDQLKEQKVAVSKIEIFGDSIFAMDEVEDFLFNLGYIFERTSVEGEIRIIIKGRESKSEEANTHTQESIAVEEIKQEGVFEDKILFFKDDRIGEGELGQKVMDTLLHNLANSPILPKEIVFMNRGVLLCADISRYENIISDLSILQKRGVKLLVCKTCLEYFNLIEHLIVGEISTGAIVLEKMLKAQGVISF